MTVKYTERFNKLWSIYDNQLAHGKKGSKFPAQKAFDKYTEDEQDRIIEDTKALMRYFKTQTKPDRIPHLSTWLNQQYFDQEIPSQTEKQPAEVNYCHCGEQTIGPRFRVCHRHYETKEQRQKLTSVLNSLGLYIPGQSLQELSKNCREYLQKNGAYGKLLNTMTSSLQPAKPGSR